MSDYTSKTSTWLFSIEDYYYKLKSNKLRTQNYSLINFWIVILSYECYESYIYLYKIQQVSESLPIIKN